MASIADAAVIALQDVLNLDGTARMNRPGTAQGNRGWRFGEGDLTPAMARRLGELTALTGRA